MQRSSRVLAALLFFAAFGCSGGGSGAPAISDPTPGDPSVGSVTLRASFPSAGAPATSLIHPSATAITVTWQATAGTLTGTANLTPAAPSATVKLPIGQYLFTAQEKDNLGAVIETAGTAGKVIAGDNAVVITFLNGTWTFKDSAGANSPIELLAQKNDLTGPLVLNGFALANRANTISTAAVSWDKTIPARMNLYDLTFLTNDNLIPNKQTQANILTQFDGGSSNLGVIAGTQFDVTTNTANGPSGQEGLGVGQRWIMIMGIRPDQNGGGGSPSDQAVRKLLPQAPLPANMISFFDAHIVDGLTIQGYLFEIIGKSAATSILENQAPLPKPATVTKSAQSANTPFLNLVVTDYNPIVLCRDGFNAKPVDGIVSLGNWDFRKYDCSVSPCVPTTQTCGVDINNDGKPEYYTCGSLTGPDTGECNWGLTPAGADLGEYCDQWNSSTNTCTTVQPANGIYWPWNFRDLNGDGVVNTGSFYLKQYAKIDTTIDLWFYPFTAKATPIGPMAITIQ